MKTILVDDEIWSMSQFEMECQDMKGIEVVGKFSDSYEALAYAEKNQVEFALLDVEMPGMNGIELGKRLRKIYPEMILIYITGYEQYIKEAMLSIKADYYILKPYSREDIEDAVTRALSLSARQKKRVYFRTFGNFEMMVDGNVIPFSNAKAKELIAICVDLRGGNVSIEYAVSVLWEDRAYDSNVKSLYRKAIIYLRGLFEEYHISDVFESERGYCHINIKKVDCDYYRFLEKKNLEDEVFNGEYMFQYSWAEETAANLSRMTGAFNE